MKIIEKLLTANPYSRPGRKPIDVKAVILHWTGIPMQSAAGVWGYFEKDCPANKHYSSAHYIIGLDGAIYHAVPDSAVAYHCGASQKDPASGKIYTDWAREKLGSCAASPESSSPNNCTIGIELCVTDAKGNFTAETLDAAVELTAHLLKKHHLSADDIGTHHMVVGWKECPLLWARDPALLGGFKERVKNLLETGGDHE
jgi:N-acetylmuramoyl-L-alanine amidase